MILHHFAASPFSEKIRLILGYKGIEWQSVQVPRILPKPDLMPLTGGYRRTPVLQIGRDVYADTRLIARVLEARAPRPSLLATDQPASLRALEDVGDRQLFLAAIPVLLSPPGRAVLAEQLGADGLAAFRADRAALFENGAIGAPDAQFSAAVWKPMIAALDDQLANTDFILGSKPTLADFALYHPIWYVRGNRGVADTLSGHAALLAWADRMAAIGHGQSQPLDSRQALAAARDTPDFEALDRHVEPSLGLSPGDAVRVAATDYGADPVYGKLYHADESRVTIERKAPGIGVLRNHFPRSGFRIDAAECRGDESRAGNSAYAEG